MARRQSRRRVAPAGLLKEVRKVSLQCGVINEYNGVEGIVFKFRRREAPHVCLFLRRGSGACVFDVAAR
jgi:hypothetical protein